MPVLTYPSGPLEANCFLCHNGKDAILIDPAVETEELLNELKSQGLTLQGVFLTHLHFDHAYGCAKLQEATNCTIYAGQEDIDEIDMLMGGASRWRLPEVQPFKVSPIAEGEYDFGSLHCVVSAVPGHSPGSRSYYVASENAVFTGDVLFYRSVGRTDFPGCSLDVLKKSIREKLYTLPDATIAYTGHGLDTVIGAEKEINPYCRAL